MSAFDKYLHAVILRGEDEARADSATTVEAHHLLLAIAEEPDPTVHRLLASVDLDHASIRTALGREFEHSLSTVGVSRHTHDLPRPGRSIGHPGMAASAKLALERGFAAVPRKTDLRPAHLLLGILRARVGTVPRALALAGIDRDELINRIQQTLDNEAA